MLLQPAIQVIVQVKKYQHAYYVSAVLIYVSETKAFLIFWKHKNCDIVQHFFRAAESIKFTKIASDSREFISSNKVYHQYHVYSLGKSAFFYRNVTFGKKPLFSIQVKQYLSHGDCLRHVIKQRPEEFCTLCLLFNVIQASHQ